MVDEYRGKQKKKGGGNSKRRMKRKGESEWKSAGQVSA